LTYDSAKGLVYVANTNSENLSVVSDTNDTVVATIALGADPGEVVYDAAQAEVFVSAYNEGDVLVLSATTNAETAVVPVGSEPGALLYEADMGEVFVLNIESNTTSVISVATNSVLATVPVGGGPEFVARDDARGTTVVTNYAQGTLSMIYQPLPPPSFAVTFSETGLPLAMSWSVTVGGVMHTSFLSTIVANETAGTYPFTIGSVPGYTASITAGNVTVSSGPKTVDISFSAVPGPGHYRVSFDETGLPSGTSWGVTLNGTLLISSSVAINFTEANGSLTFEVGSVAGYSASPSTGSVDVKGGPETLSIDFTTSQSPPKNNATNPAKILGLPPLEGYALLGGIVLVVLLGLLAAILLRRRGKSSRDAMPSAPPPGAGGVPPPP